MLYVMDGSERSIIGLKLFRKKIDKALIIRYPREDLKEQDVLLEAANACAEQNVPYEIFSIPVARHHSDVQFQLHLFGKLLQDTTEELFIGLDEELTNDFVTDLPRVFDKLRRKCTWLPLQIYTCTDKDDDYLFISNLSELAEYV